MQIELTGDIQKNLDKINHNKHFNIQWIRGIQE